MQVNTVILEHAQGYTVFNGLIEWTISKKCASRKRCPSDSFFSALTWGSSTRYSLCVSGVFSSEKIAKGCGKILVSTETTNYLCKLMKKGPFWEHRISQKAPLGASISEWRVENMAPGEVATRCLGTRFVSPISTLVLIKRVAGCSFSRMICFRKLGASKDWVHWKRRFVRDFAVVLPCVRCSACEK